MSLIEVVGVVRAPRDSRRNVAYALDFPVESQLFEGTAFEVSGWAAAKEGIGAVEIILGGTVVQRVPAHDRRIDVGRLYPDWPAAGQSGFHATVDLANWRQLAFDVSAVTRSGERFLIATITARRTWREDLLADEPRLVSVLVAANAAAAAIKGSVEAIRRQTYPHFEIVLVRDRSNDAARHVVSAYAEIRVIEAEEFGSGAAWNTGLRQSRGDFLIFLDASQQIIPNAISDGLLAFRQHPESARVIVQWIGLSLVGTFDLADHSKPHRNLGLFRRSVFESVGVFDPRASDPRMDMRRRIAAVFPVYPSGH